MDHLEGQSLARRLRRGSLATQELLEIAIAIADALASAHRLGVFHLNLNPANIVLTKSGAKVLNFGFAEAFTGSEPSAAPVAASQESGDVSGEHSRQYLAPEQLDGKTGDARSDIYALGGLICQMANGESLAALRKSARGTSGRTFDTSSVGSVPELEAVVKKCLRHDPDDRWQSASDLASELRWIAESQGSRTVADHPKPRKYRERIAWALVALVLLTAVALGLSDWANRKPATVLRAQIFKPNNIQFNFLGDASGPLVISPDGRHLVYSGIEGGTNRRLYVRSLDALPAQAIVGTDDATSPFWSPDSRSIGFFAKGKLKRVEVNGGGLPVTICDAPDARGGSWSRDGVILFAPTFTSGFVKVSANGGSPTEARKLDPKYTSYRWPWFLPDGKHYLYFAGTHMAPTGPENGVYLASLDGKENRFLFSTLANAIYASGHLLFLRGNTLMAQPFDASTGKLEGDPAILHDEVQFDLNVWRGMFTASDNTLIYQPGIGAAARTLGWFDRSGRQIDIIGGREAYNLVQLSSDEKRLAVSVGQQNETIWTYGLQGNAGSDMKTRLNFGDAKYTNLVWSPDGKQIAYSASRTAPIATAILTSASSGAEKEQQLLEPKPNVTQSVCDWSPDGRYLLYIYGNLGTGSQLDLWLLPVQGDHTPVPYSTVPGDKTDAKFSPNGRWVAYASRETKIYQIYVAPFPWNGAKYQISTGGGRHPRWRADGKELFFQVPGANQIMSAEVNSDGAGFGVGKVKSVFVLDGLPDSSQLSDEYDVTRDGQRFLAITSGGEASMPLTIVSNWTRELKE